MKFLYLQQYSLYRATRFPNIEGILGFQITTLFAEKNHGGPTQSVCVADCYFIVNVLDLPFASPIAIYR